MGTGDVAPRHELEAAVRAHRELGPEYEDAVVDSIVDKIETRLAERGRAPAVRRFESPPLPIVLGSLGIAIPLVAVAGDAAGLAGVIVVCIAIVLVNLLASIRD
ncbi:MAG TPA: hypothetical protein VH416_02640 [Gaiellaceae bacterium]